MVADVEAILAGIVPAVPVTTVDMLEIVVAELALGKVIVGTVLVMIVPGVELDNCVVTIGEPLMPEKREEQSLE